MNVAARWRDHLRALSPWKRWGVAFALGALTTLALPPLHLIFFLVPAFSGLVWLIGAGEKPRAAFWTGWWFGFGFFAAGLYWISFALLVDAAQFGWLIPFAVIGLGGGFAFYPAFVAWGVRRLCGAEGSAVSQALMLAALWTVGEWTRAWFLTGFPWNLIGSVWAFSDAALQPAAWIGTYGLGLLSVAVAALPAAFCDAGPRPARALALGVVVLGIGGAAGWMRVPSEPVASVDNVRLRLVQPAIKQAKKWQPDLRWGHVVDQVKMGAADAAPGDPPPTHIIWAETAAPLALNLEKVSRQVIGANTPRNGLTITGAIRTTPRGERPFQVWNSLFAIDTKGDIAASYDKFHLVPFGEYMPFGETLGLKKITAGRTDFTPGPGPATVALPGLPPVSPLICYEIIFPRGVVDLAHRPGWILNLTNDAWYGRTAGPHQHFATARLRAVEEGLPVVRVANSGISGVVDPFGRVVASLALGTRGTVDSDLPHALAGPTVYARTGNWPTLLVAGLLVLFARLRRSL